MNIKSLSLIPEAIATIYNLSDTKSPIWTGITNVNGKVVDTFNNLPYLSYGNYRLIVEHCDYDTQTLDFSVPDNTMMTLQLPCSSAMATHSITTGSVHNFDVMGDAPAQIHDNTKHSLVFENMTNKGIPGGYCELDKGGYIPTVRLPLITPYDMCIEEYSNHLGTVDNFTQNGISGGGTTTEDVVNHKMDLSTNLAISHARFETKKVWTLSSKPIIVNILINSFSNGSGGSSKLYIGLNENFTYTASVKNFIGIYYSSGYGYTIATVSNQHTKISSLQNGDLITISAKSTDVSFYRNGVLFATHTNIPTASLKMGASVNTTSIPTSAMTVGIDMMSIKVTK